MSNNNLINKVGWVLTSSSLGLLLSGSVHAADVRQLAAAESTSYVVAKLTSNSIAYKESITPQEALQRGLQLAGNANSEKDHVMAFEYLSYAAKQGLAEAQFQCALMHLDNQYAPADDERAVRLLENAIAQGHKQAEVALNYMRYAEDGIGC